MADTAAKPITTSSLQPSGSIAAPSAPLAGALQPVEQVSRPAPAGLGPGEDMVSVKALKFFPDRDKSGNIEQKGPDSEPFEVPRHRAAELRANGLIEYANTADQEREIADKTALAGKAIRDKSERDTAARAASKGKPLVNPKIDMAEPPATK